MVQVVRDFDVRQTRHAAPQHVRARLAIPGPARSDGECARPRSCRSPGSSAGGVPSPVGVLRRGRRSSRCDDRLRCSSAAHTIPGVHRRGPRPTPRPWSATSIPDPRHPLGGRPRAPTPPTPARRARGVSAAVAQPADPSIPLAAHPVPQLGAAQGAALQVLVCVHHAAPQGRPVARGDADNLDRTHVRQRTGYGGQRRRRHRLPSVLTGITRRHRRQRDDPSAMHLQHRVTAAHVPRPTPGVVPRHPCAHAQRQRPPRDRRFRFHRLPNPSETLVRQGPAADRDHAASVCMRGACVQNILWAILSPEGREKPERRSASLT